MTQTTVDECDRTFLVLRVAAARDDSPAAGGSGTRWCAHVCDEASPLAGLYAFAETLPEARDAVAVLAWTAVLAGDLLLFGLDAGNLAGIHLALTTTEVYDAAWLAAAVANPAA